MIQPKVTSGPRKPPSRRLRIYALDPSLQTRLETAFINQLTVSVPWEPLDLGPVGEYLEVVDYDPASDYFYAPVNLEHQHLLAQDGLQPSEGNPQFHQQMVYAVAMVTIRNFERAFGRLALWAPRRTRVNGKYKTDYVQRLRIYPHALREANAYYSPSKKALLFGYFPADGSDPATQIPGGMVFTCLSHDIIAHETTHALLDGVHRRFIEATNPDVLAFHEAFSDIVALFQHFSMKEVLAHQISRTRGDLSTQNLLAELASQFGRAMGAHGALRDAIGGFDKEAGAWQRHKPDPAKYQSVMEPHDRGALLVAAVFDAFIAIYERRSADLLRIASGGSGILPEGHLHPDLVNRLAQEAAKAAQHVLTMCIRALDYCPPFDITFGEYLRALITADRDLVPDDDFCYRVALIEAFRRRGIYPYNVRTLSEESLIWRHPSNYEKGVFRKILPSLAELRESMPDWDLSSDRHDVYEIAEKKRGLFNVLIKARSSSRKVDPRIVKSAFRTMGMDNEVSGGKFEVHSLRPARRLGPDGDSIVELIVELTQRRPYFNGKKGPELPPTWNSAKAKRADGWLRGGCTLLINMETGDVRYCIRKSINSKRRMKDQANFQQKRLASSLRATYMGTERIRDDEPFALLHRLDSEEYQDV